MTAQTILVTAATGALGRLVVAELLKANSGAKIVAAVRNPAAAEDLKAAGAEIRHADYLKPDTLDAAFAGVDKLLLISSNDLAGGRAAQHRNAIDAAVRAGVGLVAYTSILHADRSPIGLAKDHLATEVALREAGVPAVILRNGWYTENYTLSVPALLEHGAVFGSAGEGLISSAARADYASAAVSVLLSDEPQADRTYELAGDEAYRMSELAAEIGKVAGKPVVYRNLSEADYRDALLKAGLPEPVAALLADADVGASKNALFDDSRALSRLIGRPTTLWRETIAEAVRGVA